MRHTPLIILLTWCVVVGTAMAVIGYASMTEKHRATECSEMLHGTVEATSIEVGACLLQFNQPLTTGGE